MGADRARQYRQESEHGSGRRAMPGSSPTPIFLQCRAIEREHSPGPRSALRIRARPRPARLTPCAVRRAGSPASAAMASASRPKSRGGTRKPVSPCRTTSRQPGDVRRDKRPGCRRQPRAVPSAAPRHRWTEALLSLRGAIRSRTSATGPSHSIPGSAVDGRQFLRRSASRRLSGSTGPASSSWICMPRAAKRRTAATASSTPFLRSMRETSATVMIGPSGSASAAKWRGSTPDPRISAIRFASIPDRRARCGLPGSARRPRAVPSAPSQGEAPTPSGSRRKAAAKTVIGESRAQSHYRIDRRLGHSANPQTIFAGQCRRTRPASTRHGEQDPALGPVEPVRFHKSRVRRRSSPSPRRRQASGRRAKPSSRIGCCRAPEPGSPRLPQSRTRARPGRRASGASRSTNPR